jgi:hypothetical protein
MTFTEAQHAAAALGLEAVEAGSWCLLRDRGCTLSARGGTWEEAFRLLEETAQRASVCEECSGAGCLWCAGRQGT